MAVKMLRKFFLRHHYTDLQNMGKIDGILYLLYYIIGTRLSHGTNF